MPVGPPGQPWSRWSGFWGFPPFLALVQAITVTVHLQDMDMVGETVEQCPCQAFGAEHLGPFIEGQIAGQQGGAPLVTLAEHLEQEFRAGLAERHEAEFVDNQQLVFCQLFLEAQQAFLVPGLHQLVDQRRRRDEANGEAFLTRRQAKTEGDVGLTGA